MKKMNGISGRTAKPLLGVVALMALLVGVAASSRGQEQISKRGIVTPLAGANLVFDGEPACLKVARENGDPDKGASTFLLEAPSGCVVPTHYHTAEEQLMVFGIFPNSCVTERECKNPSLVTLDEGLKRQFVSTLGGGD